MALLCAEDRVSGHAILYSSRAGTIQESTEESPTQQQSQTRSRQCCSPPCMRQQHATAPVPSSGRSRACSRRCCMRLPCCSSQQRLRSEAAGGRTQSLDLCSSAWRRPPWGCLLRCRHACPVPSLQCNGKGNCPSLVESAPRSHHSLTAFSLIKSLFCFPCLSTARGLRMQVWKTHMGRNRGESTMGALRAVYRDGGGGLSGIGAFWAGTGPKVLRTAFPALGSCHSMHAPKTLRMQPSSAIPCLHARHAEHL